MLAQRGRITAIYTAARHRGCGDAICGGILTHEQQAVPSHGQPGSRHLQRAAAALTTTGAGAGAGVDPDLLNSVYRLGTAPAAPRTTTSTSTRSSSIHRHTAASTRASRVATGADPVSTVGGIGFLQAASDGDAPPKVDILRLEHAPGASRPTTSSSTSFGGGTCRGGGAGGGGRGSSAPQRDGRNAAAAALSHLSSSSSSTNARPATSSSPSDGFVGDRITHEARLRVAFEALDIDSHGAVGKRELYDGLRRAGVDGTSHQMLSIWRRAHADPRSQGPLTWAEFRQLGFRIPALSQLGSPGVVSDRLRVDQMTEAVRPTVSPTNAEQSHVDRHAAAVRQVEQRRAHAERAVGRY